MKYLYVYPIPDGTLKFLLNLYRLICLLSVNYNHDINRTSLQKKMTFVNEKYVKIHHISSPSCIFLQWTFCSVVNKRKREIEWFANSLLKTHSFLMLWFHSTWFLQTNWNSRIFEKDSKTYLVTCRLLTLSVRWLLKSKWFSSKFQIFQQHQR